MQNSFHQVIKQSQYGVFLTAVLIGIIGISQSEVTLAQLSQQQETQENGEGNLTYQSSQLGIQLVYPSSWKVFLEQTSEGCFDEINWCVVDFAPDFITALGFEDVQFEIAKNKL